MVALKICVLNAAIKKYKSIITKKKKMHDKKIIFKALFDSIISNNKFLLINNVLKDYKEV